MARNSILVLEILEILGQGHPLSRYELIEELEAPRSSVYRAMEDLLDTGWVRETGANPTKYFLSGKIVQAARGAQGMLELVTVAGPVLDRVHEATGENVQLSIFEDGFVVSHERREGIHRLRVHQPIGERVPWYASASGKAIAGRLSREELHDLMRQPRQKLADGTVTDADLLQQQISKGRADGYVISDSGWQDGVVSIGAAIVDRDGVPLAGLSTNGIKSRMTGETLSATAILIGDAAQEISSHLA